MACGAIVRLDERSNHIGHTKLRIPLVVGFLVWYLVIYLVKYPCIQKMFGV